MGWIASAASAYVITENRELEAALTVDIGTGTLRFEALLKGAPSLGAEHDRPLLARAEWLVAPTLGAIVPNWLLLISRDPVLNFRVWAERHDRRPAELLRDLRVHLGLCADEIIWFEHGPFSPGTLIGCGLDHAHIHILIRPRFCFESFKKMAKSRSDLNWSASENDDVYSMLTGDSSYLIAGSGDATIVAENVEATGPQFFRRVVGALADIGDAWDYRQYPYAHHVSQTVQTFRALESSARRG